MNTWTARPVSSQSKSIPARVVNPATGHGRLINPRHLPAQNIFSLRNQ